MPNINTKTARRRLVALTCLADLTADLNKIEAAHRAGTLKHLGNHPPGSIFFHLSAPMKGSFEGIPHIPPWWLGVLGRLLKKRILSQPFRPGFALKKHVDDAVWNDKISFDEGLALLREQVRRASAPTAAPNRAHPFFSEMTPTDWQTYYLRHAELHLSFLQF
jgi:hypothetical protein